MSEAVKAWSEEKSRSSWTPKVKDDHIAWTNMFMQIAGDLPITAYRKENVRAFKELLMKLPANASKSPEIRGLPIKQAAERAVELGLEPMSLTTLNKAINRLGAFWNWAEANFDGVPSNLTKGMKVKNNVSARDQRNPFTAGELKELFGSPLFTGCRAERFCSQRGNETMQTTARFWLPLLGLYTGARLNELCQLSVEDVRQEHDIVFLNITNEGKGQRVKSASGKRRIPDP